MKQIETFKVHERVIFPLTTIRQFKGSNTLGRLMTVYIHDYDNNIQGCHSSHLELEEIQILNNI